MHIKSNVLTGLPYQRDPEGAVEEPHNSRRVVLNRLSPSELRAIAPEHRFDFFAERSKALGDPLDSSPLGDRADEFIADLELLSSGKTSIMRREAAGMRRSYVHNDYPGDKSQESLWLFKTDLRGVVAEHGRRRDVLEPRSIYAALHNKRHTMWYQSRHRFLGIGVPLDALSLPRSTLSRFEFTKISPDRAIAALFFAAGKSLFPLERLDATGLDSFIIGLAELVLRSAAGLDPDHADSAAARRKQIEDYIQAHAADADFSVDTMAVSLGISRRRIYQLFETRTETLGETIQRYRVRKAEQLLSLSENSRLSIEQIARVSGFGSARTMTRIFQRTHGFSPSEYAHRIIGTDESLHVRPARS